MSNPRCQKCGTELRLTIQLPLPQLNDVIREAKGHWGAYHTKKKRLTNSIALLAMAAKMGHIDGRARLTFTWFPKDRRVDPDNMSHGQKYAIDGLVLAKVLAGDGYRHIASIHHEFAEPDKRDPRVEVAIVEVKA